MTGNTLVAPATSLTSYAIASGNPVHLHYAGANQHVYHLYISVTTGAWVNEDLTGSTGASASANTAMTSMPNNSNGSVRLYFLDGNQHLNETYCGPGQCWTNTDMTAYLGATPASGSKLTSFSPPADNSVHVHYEGTNRHIWHMYLNSSGGWSNQDSFSIATITLPDSGTVGLNVAGFTATACFGPSSNSACSGQDNTTASAVASALANAINAANSPATASVSGSTINLTWKTPGPFIPAVNPLSTAHDNPSFPNPSFTSQATSFSGGGSDLGSSPYVTLYSYDALGNLLSVNQKGDGSQAARVRTFTYDSLSRLLTAANPESGTICYGTLDSNGNCTSGYDAGGNLLYKTSPAPNKTGSSTVTVSYCYDKLNRVLQKGYSNPNPQQCTGDPRSLPSPIVTYTYDVGTNGIGHLTSLTDQAGSGSYTYDVMGRISTEGRTVAGVTKNLAYTYNLDGSLGNLKYPSSAVVTYTPDTAGGMVSAVDLGNSINYATAGTYGPDGSLTGFIQGKTGSFAGITNLWQYNSRLQVCRLTALSAGTLPASCTDSVHLGNVLDIGYSLNFGLGDNGNAAGIINYRDQSRNQTFTYDALNRLTSAQNAGTDRTQPTVNGRTKFWGNNYGYDPWGNLLSKTVTKCGAENLSLVSSASNQIHSGTPPARNQACATSPDYLYDAAGNMTCNIAGPLAPQSYTYDPESRITGAGGFTYIYDAGGNRVEKSKGSTGTIYWYMTPGVVAESDLAGNLQSEYLFFAGERVARKDFSGNTISVSYYFSDHLRTAAVITDSTGTIKEDEDFYPWGGELQFANGDSNHYKFTAKERDNETSLDYFGARYYGNWLGRFITADWSSAPTPIPYADLSDPQSLNQYTYVRNLPTADVDGDGHGILGRGWDDGAECSYLCTQPRPTPTPTPPKPAQPAPAPGLPPLPSLPLYPPDQPCEMDCGKAILDRAVKFLHDLSSAGSLQNVLGGIPRPPMNTNTPPLNIDPKKLSHLLNLLSIIDSTGHPPSGTQGGKTFKNDGRGGGQMLPLADGSGKSISYREWDVNPTAPTDAERIVTGSDGSAYYTNDHYQTFKKIK